MSPTVDPKFDHERELFLRALEQATPGERTAFLDGACGRDATLRARIEELIRNHSNDNFLDGPAPGVETVKVTPTDETVATGERIGRYKLLQKIGEGGCGVVYMAEQEEPVRRRVALKVIKLGMDTKSVIARFEAERQALAMMDHPNIAKVLDGGATDTGRPYFVMELVRGTKITEYCDETKLPTRDRLDLFVKVCQAVQHAHQKGIIHRDLKPSNILVTVNDGAAVPKVIDFGIAKATNQQRLTDKTVFTAFEQFIGTPAYMSPEQALMTSVDIDTRSDIYSLGVLLYEMLTGKTPLEAKELLSLGLDEMRRAIREQEPVRPSTRLSTMQEGDLTSTAKQRQIEVPTLIHQLRGDLDWIVMKALEKDRARRYETANGLASDIQRHLNNEPVLARPASTAYRFQKLVRRNKLLFAAGASIVTALLVGVVVSTWQAARAVKAERQARAETVRAQTAEQTATQSAAAEARAREQADQSAAEARLNLYAADMKVTQLALAEYNTGLALTLLDRHKPAPGVRDLRGFEWRYLWQQARGQVMGSTRVTYPGPWSLAFSPDERWLAVAGHKGASIVNVATWREQVNLTATAQPLLDVRFSPDGKQLLTAGPDEVLFWDTQSWQVMGKLPGITGLKAGRLSPDGRTLVSSSPSGLQIWDVPSRQLLHQLPGQTIRLQYGILGRANNLAFSNDGSTIAALVDDNSAPATPQVSLRIWAVDELRARGSAASVRKVVHPEMELVVSLTLSSDGRQVAASTIPNDAFTGVWDTSTGVLLAGRRETDSPFMTFQLLYRPDNRTLIGVRQDQTLRVWRPEGTNLVQIGVDGGHVAEVGVLASSANGARLASCDNSGVLKLWDAAKLDRGAKGTNPRDLVPRRNGQLQFLSDHHTLVGGLDATMSSRVLCFWDTEAGQPRRAFSNLAPWVTARLSPDEQSFALAHPDGVVEILSVTDQTVLATLRGATNEVRNIFFAPDGRRVLTGTHGGSNSRGGVYRGDPVVRLSDATSGRLLQATNLSAPVRGMTMAPPGETFAVLLEDGNLEVRRTSDFALAFRTHFNVKSAAMAFSPDGRFLAAGTNFENEVGVWDVSTHQRRFTLRCTAFVNVLMFTPDGQTLASGGEDPTVKLWSAQTGQEFLSLPQAGPVSQIAFSGDGRILAVGTSGSTQNRINLIRAPSLEEITAVEARERTEVKQP